MRRGTAFPAILLILCYLFAAHAQQGGAALATAQQGGLEALETVQVPANRPAGVYSKLVLEKEWTYELHVSGVINFKAGTDAIADALYSGIARAPRPDNVIFVEDRDLRSLVKAAGGSDAYREDHRYRATVTGRGRPANLRVFELGDYGNNEGAFTVVIYGRRPQPSPLASIEGASLLESVEVPAARKERTWTKMVLRKDVEYVVQVAGGASLWSDGVVGFDAMFWYRPDQWAEQSWLEVNDRRFGELLKLSGDSTEYRGDHVYRLKMKGTGKPLSLRVFDMGSYENNSGALSVSVYGKPWWPEPLESLDGYGEFDSLLVPAGRAKPTLSGKPLEAGAEYVLEASGVISLWAERSDGGDALYVYKPDGFGIPYGTTSLLLVNGKSMTELLKTHNRSIDYRDDHVYRVRIVGDGKPLSLKVFDWGDYGNNKGSLQVRLFSRAGIGVTGCSGIGPSTGHGKPSGPGPTTPTPTPAQSPCTTPGPGPATTGTTVTGPTTPGTDPSTAPGASLPVREQRRATAARGRDTVLTMEDGATITIPKDALDEGTQVSVQEIAVPGFESVNNKLYRIEPEGVTLRSPATLTFRMDTANMPKDADPRAVVLSFRRGKGWEKVPAQLDAQAGTVTLKTDHFSEWRLFWTPYHRWIAKALLEQGRYKTDMAVPFYAQGTAMWCYAASLQMILKHYGVRRPMWEIAEYFHHRYDEGINISSIWGGAVAGYVEKQGLPTERSVLGWVDNSELTGYLICQLYANRPVWLYFTNMGHAIVAVGYDGGGIYVHDPSGYLLEFMQRNGILAQIPRPIRLSYIHITWERWSKLLGMSEVLGSGGAAVSPMSMTNHTLVVPQTSRTHNRESLTLYSFGTGVASGGVTSFFRDETRPERDVTFSIPRLDGGPGGGRSDFVFTLWSDGTRKNGHYFRALPEEYNEWPIAGLPDCRPDNSMTLNSFVVHVCNGEDRMVPVSLRLYLNDRLIRERRGIGAPPRSVEGQVDVMRDSDADTSHFHHFSRDPLRPGGENALRVDLLRGDGTSADSFTVRFTMGLERPARLRARIEGSQVILSWDPIPDEARGEGKVGYMIWRDPEKGRSPRQVIQSGKECGYTWTDTLSDAKEHVYCLEAFDAGRPDNSLNSILSPPLTARAEAPVSTEDRISARGLFTYPEADRLDEAPGKGCYQLALSVELKPGGRIEGKTTVQAQHVIKDMKAKPGGGWEPYVRCRHKVTRVYAWSGAVSAVNQNEGTFSAGELTYTITQDTEEIPEKPAWSCRLTPAQLHWTSSPWGGGAASVRTWRYVLGGDVNRTGREIRLNAPLAPYPLNTREEYLKAD